MELEMKHDLGCELSARGKHDLRYAIGAVLFAVAALGAGPVTAQDAGLRPPVNQDRVTAFAPSLRRPSQGGWGGWDGMRHGASSFGGGYDTTGPSDTAQSYDYATPKPGTPGEDPSFKCEYGRGNPIYMSNGNKIEQELDFSDNDVELPLFFERTYNRNGGLIWGGVTGSLWITSFDYRLERAPGAVHRPDGTTLYFDNESVDGKMMELKPDPVRYLDYYDIPGGTYGIVLHRGDGIVEMYEPTTISDYFRIAQIKNPRGVGWTFSYGGTGGGEMQPSAVTHTSGKKVRLEYANGNLSKVWDTAGNLYQYGGDPSLGSNYVVYPDGVNITYHYSQEDGVPAIQAQNELTGKSFDGVRYSRFRWADVSAVGFTARLPISSEHTGGVEKFQFGYTLKDNVGSIVSVEETNPLGKKATYRFEDGKLLSVTGHPSPSCAGSVSSITYDANGNRDKVTDARGIVTDFDLSPGGRVLRKTEATGTPQQRVTESRWDPMRAWMLESKIPGEAQINYVYNGDERLAEVVERNLSSNGTTGQERKTTYAYTYHSNGKLASVIVDGPLPGNGDASTSTYSAAGELLTIGNSLGHTVSYTNYNGLGLPGKVTGVNGDVSEFDYDVRGRVIAERRVTAAGTAETRYRYAHGLLAATTSADGVETRYVYDAARRLTDEYRQEADGWYSRRHYALNAMSQPTTVEVSRANFTPETRVTGSVDGLTREGNQYSLSGWACATGMRDSIDVHVYAGGSFLASTRAEWASEPAVAASCGTQASRYRFRVPLSLEMRQQRGGQTMTVYGISPTGVGADNLVLNGSGAYAIPAAAIAGQIGGITDDGQWNYFVEGWACSVGVSTPIEVHLYAGGPYGGGGTMVGNYRADVEAGAAVQQVCESNSTAHRFRIALPLSVRRQFGGQQIHIHGISPVGMGNPVLGGSGAYTIPAVVNNSEIVSYQAPAHMISGNTTTITVQVRNTGNVIWNAPGGDTYYLGKDSVLYAQPERIAVAGQVAPGQIATFTYSFQAGRTPTSQQIRVPFGGRMIGDAAGWFGPAAEIRYISVEDPTGHCTGRICEDPR
jgi:YD repeat-containing protein